MIRENICLLKDMQLPIDIDKLKGNTFLGPLLIDLSYFIHKMRRKIRA
jgi:hypothetical protein